MSSSDKKKLDLQELMEAVQNLDMENVGGWPTPIKLAAAVLVFVGVVFLGYMFSISDGYAQVETLQRTEADLMQKYEAKAFKAQNLDQYRKQLDDMKEMFGSLLSQLPKETEVPGLLEDITHTGLGSGLEFKKIELGQEAQKEFYAELPITIDAAGDFHGFGSFVSGVAALPRIVTMGDFVIKPAKGDVGRQLDIVITAKTYRYSTTSSAAKPGSANIKGGKK